MRIEIKYDPFCFLHIVEVNTRVIFVMVFLCLVSYFLFKKEMEEWMSSSLCTSNCVYFSPASFPSPAAFPAKAMPLLPWHTTPSPSPTLIFASAPRDMAIPLQKPFPRVIIALVHSWGGRMGVRATTEESVREAAGWGRGLISSLGIGRSRRTAKTQTQD